MDSSFFLQGLLIGLSIAAPVGPIGVLCIRRSLAEGSRAGFAVGMGAATADAAYGAVAAFGLTAISGFLTDHQRWLSLAGGIFLCSLGIRTFLSKPAPEPASAEGKDLVTLWLSTFFLTLTNPATILSFIAVFGGLGLGSDATYPNATIMVLGVFLGSAAWWLFLSNLAGSFRSRVTPAWMQGINRLSGITLLTFGLYVLSRVFKE